MDWQILHQRELTFLQDQLQAAHQRIERFQRAYSADGDPAYERGVKAMLHVAERRRDVLTDLTSTYQSGRGASSLESLILCKLKQYSRQAAQHTCNWRCGHPVPAAYWDAETARNVLIDVLGRYHALRRGAPDPSDNRPQREERELFAFPWYADEEPN